MNTPLDALTLDQLIERCHQERVQYRTHHVTQSPACIRIFQRAFHGDEAAWEAVFTIFEPYMRACIGTQSRLEVEDVLQEVRYRFARAMLKGTGDDLIASGELGSILTFLRTTTKRMVLYLLRGLKIPDDIFITSLDAPHDNDGDTESAHNIADPKVNEDAHILRATLWSHIATLVNQHDDTERIILILFFIRGHKPREIVRLHPEIFPTTKDVNTVVQRLKRRFLHDTVLRDLAGQPDSQRQEKDANPSLEIRMSDEKEEEERMHDNDCDLDEAFILEYITGDASAEIRAAIEQSPACMAAAKRMAQELKPLMTLFSRLECPDIDMLVAYQEGTLDSSVQQVVQRHVTTCSQCQEELHILTAIDMVPLELAVSQPDPDARSHTPTPVLPDVEPMLIDRLVSLGKRLVAAIYQPAPELQLLGGEVQIYQTPQVAVTVSTDPGMTRSRTWILSVEVRSIDGELLNHLVEAVVLQSPDASATEQRAEVDESGLYTCKDLVSGSYQLFIVMPQEIIQIHTITIGEPDEGRDDADTSR